MSILTRVRNFERIREISEVAVRHGFGYFVERRRLLRPILRRRRGDEAPPAQRGRHIREMLDELGPTFVKFGQLLSTRPDIVPADIVQELVQLQDQVSPLPFDTVKAVVEEDLGLTLARAFESFDAEPLAAASIGQVHAAVLPGGQRVVVKVQRPGAARQIHRDIDVLYQLADLLEGHIELGASLTSVVQEFARNISRELDYILEGRNADRFRVNFRDSPGVKIPRVYWRYSSRRMLTLERLDGLTLNAPEILSLPIEERRTLAEAITDCWFRQILRDGFFHADPHPANIVYLGEGRLGLLDFGTAGFLRREDLEEGVRLFLHVMDSDILGIKRSLKRLGVHWSPSAEEAVSQSIEEGFSRYFGVSLASIDVSSLLRQVFDIIYSLHLRLPSRFLLLDKALITMEGVVSRLYPDLNFFSAAQVYADELQRQQFDPHLLADRIRRHAGEQLQMLRDYPVQLHTILDKAQAGELEIRFRHTGLERMMERLDHIANRLVVALVCIGLGLASTGVAVMVKEGPHLWGLSLWGLPGLIGSLLFGGWLVYAIMRSGRL